jgi:hypothetical protein
MARRPSREGNLEMMLSFFVDPLWDLRQSTEMAKFVITDHGSSETAYRMKIARRDAMLSTLNFVL